MPGYLDQKAERAISLRCVECDVFWKGIMPGECWICGGPGNNEPYYASLRDISRG